MQEIYDAFTDEKAVFINVDSKVLVKRLCGRRVCKSCGISFHIEFSKPEQDGVCDSCSGELYQREDDNEEVIQNRMLNYEKSTIPVIEFYKNKGKYVEIDGNGPNALDFHIAYYIGELAAADPTGHFHIISKDRGFDPLIRHLKGKNIQVRRESDLAEIPNLQIPKKAKKDDKIDAIVKNLVNRGQSRPRKVKTLQNVISNLVSETLDEAELAALVDELKKRKHIVVTKGNIKYTLPAG